MSAPSEPGVSKAKDLNPATLSTGKAVTAAALVAQARSKKRVSPATPTTAQPNNNSAKKKKTQPASSTTQAQVNN